MLGVQAMNDDDRPKHAELRRQLRSRDVKHLDDKLIEAVEHLLDHIESLERRVAQLEGGSTPASAPGGFSAP